MLKLSNISKSFRNQIIFDELDLVLLPGVIYGLLGHNGSGKSTLAKIMLGLEDFGHGRISLTLQDEVLTKVQDIKAHLYYVFQNPDHQIVGTIVSDDVAFGIENISTDYDLIVSRVNEALTSVGLLDFKDTNPLMLSGGQKQRLAIAGALAVRAKYIILDEPSAMLDPEARVELWSLLKDLKAQGFCILVVTHLCEEIRHCDSLYVVNDKRLKRYDDVSYFFDSGLHKSYGIEEDDLSIISESGLVGVCDSI